MADPDRQFDYVAIDAAGRRRKGAIAATSDAAAFERLRRDGLSPLRIRAAAGAARGKPVGRVTALTDREMAAFLFDLAALLKAGADMRSSLSLLATRSKEPGLQAICRKLNAEVSGGGALEQAFSRHLKGSQEFVAALVAAGEAAGDLSAGFQRAAELLASRMKLREQLVATLSYPAFILASTIAAVFVILLFVVPSLAPLVEQNAGSTPITLRILIATSQALRANLTTLTVLVTALGAGLYLTGRAGLLSRRLDQMLLDGPVRTTFSGFVFGGFAITLGSMLSAGAPMSDALKLAVRAVGSPTARRRLEPVVQNVREGGSLSSSFDRVNRFPIAIARLAAVGEASGALGPMLVRAGKLEEEAAVRRLEAVVRVAGPVLIVGLGGLIGLLMASLLSGVSQIGQSALQ